MCRIKSIIDYQKKELAPDAPAREMLVRKDWTKQVIGYLLMVASIVGLLITCDFPMFIDPSKDDKSKHSIYFQILGIHALTSTHMTISMMFAHVTKRKYEPLFGNRLLCFVLMSCAVIQLIYMLLKMNGKDK